MVDLDESAKIAHKSNTSNHRVKTLHLKSIQNKNIEHHFRIMLEDEKMFRIWQRSVDKSSKVLQKSKMLQISTSKLEYASFSRDVCCMCQYNYFFLNLYQSKSYVINKQNSYSLPYYSLRKRFASKLVSFSNHSNHVTQNLNMNASLVFRYRIMIPGKFLHF